MNYLKFWTDNNNMNYTFNDTRSQQIKTKLASILTHMSEREKSVLISDDYEYIERNIERKLEEEENKVTIFGYYGTELKGDAKKFHIDKFMSKKIERMKEKSDRRILCGKAQIDRLEQSQKKHTYIQVRNTFEANILIKYARSKGLSAHICYDDNITSNFVKKMEITIPDYSTECPGECPCKHYHVNVENEKRKVCYVLCQK